MVALTWETQADWDAAQSRARVVTRDIGDRNPNQIWQGYDPNYGPLTDAVSYWTFDDASPVDEIGTADGVRSGTVTEQAGPLSSNSHRYDGIDDVISVDSMPLADPSASWTVNIWIYLTSRMSYRLYFSLEDTVAQESLGVGNWNDGNAKIYSAGRTPGVGSAMTLGEWTMITLKWDAGTQTASMYKNGTFDYSVAPTGGGSVFANADQITLGNRRVGANAPVEGRLSDCILFNRALTDAEIQSLYDTVNSGTLTTGTIQSDFEAVELTTTATVPTNTSVTMTVNQYDGVTSNSQTVTVPDGVATHTLTNFPALSGANYWVDINQASTSVEATSQIESVALEVNDTTPVTENLDWETQAEWDGAQSRTGLVTRSIGDRVGDDVALGYDPSYAPTSAFDSYWTLDEDTGTLTDVIGGRNGSKSGATAGVEGVLGSTAVSFDGTDDYVSVSNASIFNSLSEMTWSMWVKTTANSTSGYNSLIGKGDLSGTGSFLIEFDNNLLTLYVRDYSTYDEADPITLTGDEWHHIVVKWDSATGARFYIDGVSHGSGSSTAVSMPNTSSPVVIGSDLPYGTYYSGVLDEVMFANDDDAPSPTQLYDAGNAGSLTTDVRTSAGAASSLVTTASIPAGTSIEATVYQDTTGDGVANNTDTVSLSNGTQAAELTGFESVSGGAYWVDFDFATTDTTLTPTLSSASVETDARTRLFTATVRLSGQMVDIPVYDVADVDRSCARMRNTVTGDIGAANIIDASSATAIIRHPVDGLLGIETDERTGGYGDSYGDSYGR